METSAKIDQKIRILGVDPGLATAGVGVIQRENQRADWKPIAWDDYKSKAGEPLADRLKKLGDWLRGAIEEHQPDEFAIEEMFFALNAQTAVQMAHARGVCLLVAAEAGLQVAEYSALSIKQTVAGYGRADKDQVGKMVVKRLKLDAVPKPSHAADALAIALCHAASRGSRHLLELTKQRTISGPASRRRSKKAWRNIKVEDLETG
jgi:crossover junction endodeoxyribonuclease RuvC